MQMSRITCKHCGSVAPWPFDRATDDEAEFSEMLMRIRSSRVACPYCGGHKWIRRAVRKI
jgi:DNA-directed RNA polymerase subunit RPC12/RpoP